MTLSFLPVQAALVDTRVCVYLCTQMTQSSLNVHIVNDAMFLLKFPHIKLSMHSYFYPSKTELTSPSDGRKGGWVDGWMGGWVSTESCGLDAIVN